MKAKGKFWPHVRSLIWEKAQQLYREEQVKGMADDFKGITATYFYTAKLIVLRDLWREKKGLPTIKEEEAMQRAGILGNSALPRKKESLFFRKTKPVFNLLFNNKP